MHRSDLKFLYIFSAVVLFAFLIPNISSAQNTNTAVCFSSQTCGISGVCRDGGTYTCSCPSGDTAVCQDAGYYECDPSVPLWCWDGEVCACVTPIPTPTPTTTPTPLVGLTFTARDGCSGAMACAAIVTLNANYGGGTSCTIPIGGSCTINVTPNTAIGWSSASTPGGCGQYNPASGSVNSGGGTTVNITHTRICGGGTPIPTPTPTPTPVSCPAEIVYTETNQASIDNYCRITGGTTCPAGSYNPLSCHVANSGGVPTWAPFGSACTQPYCTGCGCVAITPTPTPVSIPTSSLTVARNGGQPSLNITANPGDNIQYSWSSTNATAGSTTLQIYNSSNSAVAADTCGNLSGNFPAISGTSGTTSGGILACQVGFRYQFTYTTTGSGGTSSPGIANISVAAVGTTPTPTIILTPTPSGPPLPSGGPGAQAGIPVPLSWNIINPLAGLNGVVPTDIFGVIFLVTNWILNVAGSLIIMLIIYAGVRFMLSRGNPGEIQRAKGIMWWALIGFAIILVGKGFIFLVDSVLRGNIPTLP